MRKLPYLIPLILSTALAQQAPLQHTLSTDWSMHPVVLDEAKGHLYATTGSGVMVFDLTTHKVLTTIKLSTGGSNGPALSPDGKTLYVISGHPPQGPGLTLVDTTSWTVIPITVEASRKLLTKLWDQVLLTPDGQKAILLFRTDFGWDELAVFDTQTQEVTLWKLPGSATAYTISSDGQHLAVSTPRQVHLLDPRNGQVIRSTPQIETGSLLQVSFSPDGKTLVGVNDRQQLFVWNVATGTLDRTVLTPGILKPTFVKFTPNGRYVVFGDTINSTEEINIFDTTTWTEVQSPPTGYHEKQGATFTRDGKRLYLTTTLGIRVFDTSLLNPMDARVLFNVEPADATITIGGQRPVLNSDGTIGVFTGVPQEVKVSKPFFETFTTTVNLKGGETRNLNVLLERDRGALSLTSTPRGATVWIDGEEKGKTPLKLSRLDAGEYTVTLKLNDHRDFTQKVTVQSSKDAVVNATLVLSPGIKLTSKPTGARVYIGDTLVCEKTPCTLRNLPPSIQEFTFKLDGYQDLKARAVVPDENTGNLDVTLKK